MASSHTLSTAGPDYAEKNINFEQVGSQGHPKRPKSGLANIDDPEGGEEEWSREPEADQEQSASGVDAAFQAPPSEDEWLMPIGTDPSEVRGICRQLCGASQES